MDDDDNNYITYLKFHVVSGIYFRVIPRSRESFMKYANPKLRKYPFSDFPHCKYFVESHTKIKGG